jgi:Arc/MetJ-type ribon-helix-helix transcriptional regulator
MKRTTVKLPDELDARLRHEARRQGRTVSDLTREAIAHYLQRGGSRGEDAPGQGRTGRRLLAAGAGHSGRVDISERIEEILAAEVRASRS